MTKQLTVVAVLESMYDWRGMTTGAGYVEAPRHFTINPHNHSGKRLYKLVGPDVNLIVTNACRELGRSANDHGIPDPWWLQENLHELHKQHGVDLILVCGKIAQNTFSEAAFGLHQKFEREPKVLKILHPAARTWSVELIKDTSAKIRDLLQPAVSFV